MLVSLYFLIKKMYGEKNDPEFDVTISSYDRVKLCKLVGLYRLDLLT